MKLQDAYVSESGIYVGSWNKIGYAMKATTSFNYTEGSTLSEGTTKLEGLGLTDGWIATSLAKLNDCASGATWTVQVAESGAGTTAAAPVVYKTVYSDESNCSPLTASFEKLTTYSSN